MIVLSITVYLNHKNCIFRKSIAMVAVLKIGLTARVGSNLTIGKIFEHWRLANSDVGNRLVLLSDVHLQGDMMAPMYRQNQELR